MQPLAFIRNDPDETFGIAPRVYDAEHVPWRVVDALGGEHLPELGEVSGVVMFGGSMNVDQVREFPFLDRVRNLTRRAVDARVPFLGICLGGQLLARAFDYGVAKAPAREIGFEPLESTHAAAADPLTASYATGDMVFHWHEDMVELPAGAELLATSSTTPVQAYRIGDRAWGFQFHLEIDRPEIDLWIEGFGPDTLATEWGKSPERIRAEADRHLVGHERKGAEVFRAFARIAAQEG
ncbi:MAG: type 1 glutamine amidotransferase [Actinomycetota bacterium]